MRLLTTSSNDVRRRAVVLGASNVMRGLPQLVRAVRGLDHGPVDILMATGHGRSYGTGSRVFGRELPPILGCGVWHALAERRAVPTAALVTDVGNDILYGASAETIVAWANEALGRLRRVAERIVLAGLPLEGIEALGPARYLAVRSILFPRCRLSLVDARARARDVHAGLREIAAQHGVTFVEPLPAWYGLDPIHVARRARASAWNATLASWRQAERVDSSGPRPDHALTLRLLRPEHRRLFGIEQLTPQPSGHLRDGTRISLF